MDSQKKRKKRKKNQNPIYASTDSLSKAKTEIRNKANLKKTTSSVINDND